MLILYRLQTVCLTSTFYNETIVEHCIRRLHGGPLFFLCHSVVLFVAL